MPRVVVLGSGTEVGKTRASVLLLRELARLGLDCIGLKPIESGFERGPNGPHAGSDAHALDRAGSLHMPGAHHPFYALSEPVSPHLAARRQGLTIDLVALRVWVAQIESGVTRHVMPHRALWSVVELAGGVFSPLSEQAANFDLACALDPAIWLLVAPDSLGVLHDLSASLQAMRARGRMPNHVVLSGARPPDASTGSNASELALLGIVSPTAVLQRDDDEGMRGLVARLLADQPNEQ